MGGVLAAATLATTPLLLAALGGLVNMRGGIVNISLEGDDAARRRDGRVGVGARRELGGRAGRRALAGAALGLLFSLSVTRLGANEIIAGLGLNILVAGAIGYALGGRGPTSRTASAGCRASRSPGSTPFRSSGTSSPGKDPLTYAAWIAVPVIAWSLANTRAGLRLRATGPAEGVARSLGVPSLRIRDASTVFAGALAGLGGGSLALGIVGLFNVGMVAGRGYVALAAFYFGRSRPGPPPPDARCSPCSTRSRSASSRTGCRASSSGCCRISW